MPNGVWEWAEGIWNAMVNAWNGFASWLGDAISGAWDALYAVGKAIMDGLTQIGMAIMGAITWLWDAICSFGEWLWSGLNWLGQQIYNAFYSFGEWIVNSVSWVVNQIASFFTNAYNAVRDAFVSWVESAQDWYVGVVNTFIDKMERIVLADITLIGMWKGLEKFAETGKFRYLIGAFASPFVAALASGIIGKVMKGSAEVRPIPRGTPIWPLFSGAPIEYTPTEPDRAERRIGTEEKPIPGAILDTALSYAVLFPPPVSAPYSEVGYEIIIREPEVSEESVGYETVIREPAYETEQVSYEIVA
ncbi:MAG: hypothetical protein DRP01_02540 [Archaeoglobales archaeon]|nr:MAG: hypothetical protein DRP01_02540 [Archaeoglobales archaeon]